MDKKVFLKSNTMVEPLVNSWFAKLELISPMSEPLIIKNSHLKLLDSFLVNPDAHADAIKNPKMIGGSFVDVDKKKINDINALREKILSESSDSLEFAEAIPELWEILEGGATGASLEPMYRYVPPALKGYVELTYDCRQRASMRFLEGLLYKSKYYKEDKQSVLFSTSNEDLRPFALSTPRLPDEEHFEIRHPFSSLVWDELFKMRHTPRSYDEICEVLGVDKDSELFRSFFTEEIPRIATDATYEGDDIRVRYFGHASILVQVNNTNIFIDPWISHHPGDGESRYCYSDLPDTIDYVLITHSHLDHFVLETLLQIRHKVKCVVVPKCIDGEILDPSLKRCLKQIGFSNVIEIEEMEDIPVPGGRIMGVPFFGEHGDLNITSKIAHLVELNGHKILCAADSANIEPKLYKHIYDSIGPVNTIFLGMECDGAPISWGYGKRFSVAVKRKDDRTRKMSGSNFAQASALVKQLGCDRVFIYAMGLEPWLTHITALVCAEDSLQITESNKFIKTFTEENIPAKRLYMKEEIYLS